MASRSASFKTDSNHKSQVKLNPKSSRERRLCSATTSTKQTKDGVGSIRQDKHKNGSKTPGPPVPTPTQSHAGVKPCTQQPRTPDKKDISAGQKSASDKRRSSPTSKSRTVLCKPETEYKREKLN
ncbi:uncharacterized protein LKV04_019169 [Tautogolabrus adspersus]